MTFSESQVNSVCLVFLINCETCTCVHFEVLLWKIHRFITIYLQCDTITVTLIRFVKVMVFYISRYHLNSFFNLKDSLCSLKVLLQLMVKRLCFFQGISSRCKSSLVHASSENIIDGVMMTCQFVSILACYWISRICGSHVCTLRCILGNGGRRQIWR